MPPQWQRLNSETIDVVLTLSLWPHQTVIMAASQEKRKESFLLLLFYVFSVTWQGSFKCDFTNLKCNFLCRIISPVFRIPLISFLCKCLKSTRIYQVALNAFYKETLNNTATKKVFLTPRDSVCWHILSRRKMFGLCSKMLPMFFLLLLLPYNSWGN